MNRASFLLRRLALLSLALALLGSALLAAQDSTTSPRRLLGYYTYWSKYQTPEFSAYEIPYAKLTHINHAFVLLSRKLDGSLLVPIGLIEPELITRAHAAGVKVLVSIGGGDGVQGPRFNKIARSEVTRQAFAANVKTFLQQNNYDGVDIDWEVPFAADSANCTTLMQELRNALPSPWLITMAVTADPRGYGQGLDIPALAPILDFLNVMTYDFYGTWSGATGHNSPLLLSPSDPSQAGSVKTSMDLYTNQYGIPPAKINIGMPFYGYQFDGANMLWESCPACISTSQNYAPSIKGLIGQPGWVKRFDPVAQAPYLLNLTTPSFLTYDNPASIHRKSKYAMKTRGFGGVFMWELSADYDGKSQDLLDAMYEAWKSTK